MSKGEARRRARARTALAAAVVVALAVGTGSSQARSGPDESPLDDLLHQLEHERGAEHEHGSAGHGPGETGHADPQDDFVPFGAAAPRVGHGARQRGGRAKRAQRRSGRAAKTRAARRRAARRRAAAHIAGASGVTLGISTIDATIRGTGDPADGFQTLLLGPGEPRIVREELAAAQAGRESRRRSLLYVGQTTDWQLVDEESPARVEFLDLAANPPFPSTVSAAWRPQEALGPFAVEQAIRQINRFAGASPHPQGGGERARMDMVVMTGDQADNQQLNETAWVVKLLEGGTLNPNSGTDPSACPPGQQPSGQTADPALYAGVQDFDDYVEGQQFYDPDQPAGPKYSDWPTYPGLMDRAQLPFEAEGLDVPSYVVPGNHDSLAQGNQKAIAPFEAVGVGCIKPLVPAADLTEVANILDPAYLAGLLGSDPGQVMLVPPDPDRRYVDKEQYKQVFATGVQADAHGFGLVDDAELQASNGVASYYSWSPKPGLRMIGLDTLCDAGVTGPSANGNIDHPQWQWLERELAAAGERDELIVVFGHHPIRSLNCDVPDETPPACTAADSHGHDANPGCDADPRDSSPIHLGEDLTSLFLQHPHVVAYVAGHTHENTLSQLDAAAGGPGDFWGIETASMVDWPPQNRLIELMDNCDGTLSIFGTIIDSAAPATAPASGGEATGMSGEALASISRTLAFNDPQAGFGSGEGEPTDRNVELLVDDPRRNPTTCATADGPTPDGPDRDPGGGGGGGGDDDPREDTGDGGSLPFTGLMLGGLLLAGLGLLAGGRLLRAASSRRGPG